MGRVVSAYVMEKARSSGISPEEALTRGGNFLRVLGPMTGRSPVPKGALTQRDPNPRRFRQMDDTDRARKRFAKLQNEALDAQGDRAVFADRMSSSALKGARLFVSEDQRSGFAIDAEGEVVGLFEHPASACLNNPTTPPSASISNRQRWSVDTDRRTPSRAAAD